MNYLNAHLSSGRLRGFIETGRAVNALVLGAESRWHLTLSPFAKAMHARCTFSTGLRSFGDPPPRSSQSLTSYYPFDVDQLCHLSLNTP